MVTVYAYDMSWKRNAGALFAGLVLTACGSVQTAAPTSPAPAPTQQPDPSPSASSVPASSPTPKASPSPKPETTPSPEPTPAAPAASVACSGGPGTAMVVVSGSFLYDVTDPVRPRLVCRGIDTEMHFLGGTAIEYTTVVAKHVVIVRRDLLTGAESQIAQLRVAPVPYYWGRATWTWDGSLEVYATSNATTTTTNWQVQVHLWSSGADHVLYTVNAGVGGIESRWAQRPILEFGPDHSYVAISDSAFTLYSNSVRIFLVADRLQKFVNAGPSSGGTWLGNERFVWATMASSSTVLGKLMQWTPAGGAAVLRSEYWYGPTSSSDGSWLAGTLLSGTSAVPGVFIAPLGSGRTFRADLASSPRFVTPTIVWYASEALTSGGYDQTSPSGVIHALDVANQTDKVVTFRAGEAPKTAEGYTLCCRD